MMDVMGLASSQECQRLVVMTFGFFCGCGAPTDITDAATAVLPDLLGGWT